MGVTFECINVHWSPNGMDMHMRLVGWYHIAFWIWVIVSVKYVCVIDVLYIEGKRARSIWHDHKSAGGTTCFLTVPFRRKGIEWIPFVTIKKYSRARLRFFKKGKKKKMKCYATVRSLNKKTWSFQRPYLCMRPATNWTQVPGLSSESKCSRCRWRPETPRTNSQKEESPSPTTFSFLINFKYSFIGSGKNI